MASFASNKEYLMSINFTSNMAEFEKEIEKSGGNVEETINKIAESIKSLQSAGENIGVDFGEKMHRDNIKNVSDVFKEFKNVLHSVGIEFKSINQHAISLQHAFTPVAKIVDKITSTGKYIQGEAELSKYGKSKGYEDVKTALEDQTRKVSISGDAFGADKVLKENIKDAIIDQVRKLTSASDEALRDLPEKIDEAMSKVKATFDNNGNLVRHSMEVQIDDWTTYKLNLRKITQDLDKYGIQSWTLRADGGTITENYTKKQNDLLNELNKNLKKQSNLEDELNNKAVSPERKSYLEQEIKTLKERENELKNQITYQDKLNKLYDEQRKSKADSDSKKAEERAIENIKEESQELQKLIKEYAEYYSAKIKASVNEESPDYKNSYSHLEETANRLKSLGVEINSETNELSINWEKVSSNIKKSESAQKELNNEVEKTNKSNKSVDEEAEQTKYNKELQKSIQLVKDLGEAERKLSQYLDAGVSYESLKDNIENIGNLKRAISELPEEYTKTEQYQQALRKEMDKSAQQAKDLENNINRLGVSYGTLGNRIKESLMNTFVYGTAWRALDSLEDGLYSSIQKVKELDDAMTDIQVVTGQTDTQVRETINDYADLAYQLGVTTQTVADGSLEWLRQGKTVQDTTELLKASTMLSKIGMMDAAEATELLTSTMNGYKLSVGETVGVVDKLSALDLKYATSAGEIATALQYVASSANEAGLSIDQLMALITVGSENTRLSAETIGQAWKTLVSRFTNVKLGKFISEEGEDLNQVETILGQFGIALRDSSNEWRNLGDVINEIGQRWNTFTSVEKSAISTQVAGVRQANIFMSTMEDYSKVVEAVGVSQNSAGTAAEKYEHIMDSLDAKINQFIVTWEKLVNDLNQGGTFGSIVELGTTILQLVNDLDLIENSLRIVVPLLTFKGINSGISNLQKLNSYINKVGTSIRSFDSISNIINDDVIGYLNNYNKSTKEYGLILSDFVKITGELTEKDLARLMALKKVDKQVAVNILKQRGYTAEMAEAILTSSGYAAGVNGASLANMGFATSLKTATANLWAMTKAWAMSPMGMLTIAVGIIWALKKAYDAWNVTLAEQKEKLEEVTSVYNEAQEELKSLNSELETNKKRIEELKGKGNLTYVEKDELNNLISANSLLEAQIELEEELSRLRFRDMMYESSKTIDKIKSELEEAKKALEDYSTTEENILLGAQAARGLGRGQVGGEHLTDAIDADNLSDVIEQYKTMQSLLSQHEAGEIILSPEEIVRFEQGLTKAEIYVKDTLLNIQQYKQQIANAPLEYFSDQSEQQEMLKKYDEIEKFLYNSLGEGSYQEFKINQIINDTDYTDVINKLRTVANESAMTDEQIKELFKDTNIDEFIRELESIDGVTFEQIKSSLGGLVTSSQEAMSDMSESVSMASSLISSAENDFDSGMKSVINTYSELQSVIDEYNNAGYLSQKTLLDLKDAGIDFNKYLSEQNGQLVLNKEAIYNETKALYENKIETLKAAEAKIDSAISSAEEALRIRESELRTQDLNNTTATYTTNVRNSFIPAVIDFATSFLGLSKAADDANASISGEDAKRFANDPIRNQLKNDLEDLKKQKGEIAKQISSETSAYEDWKSKDVGAVDELIYANDRLGSSASSTADKVSQEFQDAYDEIQYMRDRGLISEEEYLNRLYALNEKYNKDNLALWRKYDLEIYKGRQQLAKDRADEAKRKAQEAADRKKKAIDKRIEALRDELDALNERYEAEDKAFELQKAQDRYNAAISTKNTRVYTNDKGWTFQSDPTEVQAAQEELEQLKIEQQRDAARKAIEDEIDRLEDLKDSYDEAVEAIDEDLDENIEDLEEHVELQDECFGEMEEDLWDLVAEAEAAAEAYIAAMQAMCSATCDDVGGGSGGGGPGGGSGGSKYLTSRNINLGGRGIGGNTGGKTGYGSRNSEGYSHDEIERNYSTTPTGNKGKTGYGSRDSSGLSHWEREHGYASGTRSVPESGFYNVDEGIGSKSGEELVFHNLQRGRMTYLEKGDSVVPADISKNLWELGSNPVQYMLEKISGIARSFIGRDHNDENNGLILENCTFPLTEVREPSDFAPALQRIAKQNRR